MTRRNIPSHHLTWIAVLTVCLLLPLSSLRGDDGGGELLTLEQAMEIAVAHNRGLLAAEARAEGAAAAIDEARSLRRPTVTAGGLFQRTDNPVFVFSNLLGQEDFREENFAVDRLNNPDPLSHWQGRVDLAYPLWAGGRLHHGLEAVRRESEAIAAETESARQGLLRRVAAHYIEAMVAERRREVANAAMAAAQRHVTLARDLFDHGLVVESDVLQAEVRQLAVAEEQLRAESARRLARIALNRTLGRPLETPFRLPEGEGIGAEGEMPPLTALLAAAEAHRPELHAAEKRRDGALQQLQRERAERLPWVELKASAETNAGELADLFDAGENWTAGVALRVSLFDGGRRKARVEQARSALEAVRLQGEELAAGITLEVHQAREALGTAEARFQAAVRGVELAERSLAIVQDRYREGLALITELLEAETALTEARLRRENARGDHLRSRVELRRATGQLTTGGLP